MDPEIRKFLSRLGFDIQVPIRRTMGRGVDTLVDRVTEEDRVGVGQLIMSAAARGDGLSKDQFPTEQHVDDFLALGYNFCFKDVSKDGKIYGFVNVYDSPLCRSTKPVLHAGYGILDPEYKATGVGTEVMSLLTMTGIALGYHGCLFRATLVTSAGLLNVKRMDGPLVTGVIPNSLYLGQGRYIEDAILYADYNQSGLGSLEAFVKRKTVASTLPAFRREAVKEFYHYGCDGRKEFVAKFSTSSLPMDVMSGEISVLQLAGDQAVLVEEMFRKAAEQGEGFAVDEFDLNGLHNRKFFRHSVTLAALGKQDNVIIGGAIIGATSLAKAQQAPSMGVYFVVNSTYRGQGYGKDIMRIVEKIARHLNYLNIVSDVLVDPKLSGLRLALNNGFYITGQLPNCAFVQGRGLTDSLVVFKNLPALVANL